MMLDRGKNKFLLRSKSDVDAVVFQIKYLQRVENKIITYCADKCFQGQNSKKTEKISQTEQPCLETCFQKQKQFYRNYYSSYITGAKRMGEYKEHLQTANIQ
ncbi:unnamed protein product [Moneuplotes crassus]|uniref:Mitochondrial import inner membrane translocase subunit n=1 Tax=Euplotes crassus TaxID=5936 RepID=A0AAD1Y7D0_EUPCR|nr:unnamed protein product [Moneuplotes crassus]